MINGRIIIGTIFPIIDPTERQAESEALSAGSFEIIESKPKDKFTDAWRVFGKYGYKSAKYWPEDSSMRKAFKTHVLNGGKTGSGHGVIVFDGEKIVR